MERVLDLGDRGRHFVPAQGTKGRPQAPRARYGAPGTRPRPEAPPSTRCSSGARPTSGASPPPTSFRATPLAAGLDAENGIDDELLAPVRAWLGSDLLRERVLAPGATSRAEVPLLLGVAGATLRGSIDLLVERDGAPPLVVDYKTDRLGGSAPAERAAKYATQRAIYALAVAEARGAAEVEVAYVFLERRRSRHRAARREAMARAGSWPDHRPIGAGEFPVAPVARRSWELCRGCPAWAASARRPARRASSTTLRRRRVAMVDCQALPSGSAKNAW